MSEIITKERMAEDRVKRNMINEVALFEDRYSPTNIGYDTQIRNISGYPTAVKPASAQWVNTPGYIKLNNEIAMLQQKLKTNVANFQSADYYALIEKVAIDLTRRIQVEEDWTDRYSNVITNFNFSESVTLKEFLEYTGWFEEMTLEGDSVPMIQQKTGSIGAVTMKSFGLGHARTLRDEIFNMEIYSPAKVNDAFARAYVNRRNIRNIIGVLTQLTLNTIAGTGNQWHASQISSYVPDPTDQYEEQLYKAIRAARYLLLGLKDCQTKQQIQPRKSVVIVGSQRVAEQIRDVIRGQLYGFGNKVQNLQEINIDEIVVNSGDTVVVGSKTHVRPAMPENKMVLFVPFDGGSPNYVLVKRTPTITTGLGSPESFARTVQARYFVQTEYYEEVLGSSSGIITGLGGGYGYAVVADVPDFEPQT